MMATQVISNSGAFFDPHLSSLLLSYCGFPDFIVARDSYGYVVSNSRAFFDTCLSLLPLSYCGFPDFIIARNS
jgi:hypothetical protein